MQTARLTEAQIGEYLRQVTGWQLDGNTIRKTYPFGDFVQAVRFVNRVAEAAERAQHHPDIDIHYSKVTLVLSTHDSGGLTEKDFALALEADDLAAV